MPATPNYRPVNTLCGTAAYTTHTAGNATSPLLGLEGDFNYSAAERRERLQRHPVGRANGNEEKSKRWAWRGGAWRPFAPLCQQTDPDWPKQWVHMALICMS